MAKQESTQKKLTRFRPPRVAISYDTTEEGGKKSQHSLPLVVGVMGNYSGHKFKKTKKLKNERFLDVNKQNFDTVVESVAPELKLKVENKLNKKSEFLDISATFKSMADFNPGKLASNIEPLREVMEMRQKLSELKSLIDSNDKLEDVLTSLTKNKEALSKFLPKGAEHTNGSHHKNHKDKEDDDKKHHGKKHS